jgi:hypothetical protein
MLPTATSTAYLETELPGAEAWAEREGLVLTYEPERLALRLRIEGPGEQAPERYLLEGRFDDYRVLPPEWLFLHPDSVEEVGAAAFPAQPPTPLGGSSIFLPDSRFGAVICAHFSRRAFGQGAPHSDWDAGGWESIETGHVMALSVGDMLARIAVEVRLSPHRMEPLP